MAIDPNQVDSAASPRNSSQPSKGPDERLLGVVLRPVEIPRHSIDQPKDPVDMGVVQRPLRARISRQHPADQFVFVHPAPERRVGAVNLHRLTLIRRRGLLGGGEATLVLDRHLSIRRPGAHSLGVNCVEGGQDGR